MRAGDGFGHGGQGLVDLPLEGEAVAQGLDLQNRSLVWTAEDRAGGWPTVAALGRAGAWAARRGQRPWRGESQIGVADQLGGPLAGALGEVPFGQGLQPPSEAFDEPGF